MKSVLVAGFVALCCSSYACAQDADGPTKWHGTVGAGPVAVGRYSGSSHFELLPLPIAYVDYDDQFYVNLFRAGAYVWSTEDKKTGIGLAIEPRLGFRSSSGDKLVGMDTRKGSLQGGPTFDLEGTWGALSLGYFVDLTGASHGAYLDAFYTKQLVKNERWEVNGAIEISRLDSKYVNYYFGVKSTEVTPVRPMYQPGAATNATLWLTGQYNLTKQYALMFGGNVTQLGSAAANSPIVERRQVPLIYIGLGWNL